MPDSRYYLLDYDLDNDEGKIFCDEEKLINIDEYSPVSGEEIVNWDNGNTLFYSTNGIPEDYLDNILYWPIFSGKFKNICDDLKINGIHLLPISIQNKISKEILENYYLLNIFNFIEALDLKKSKFKPPKNDELLKPLPHPVLIRNKIQSLDIFRLKEYDAKIFISERLKNEMEFANITGCVYEEVDVV
jgi:hypothetical protein